MAFKTHLVSEVVQVSEEKHLNWGTCSKCGKEGKKITWLQNLKDFVTMRMRRREREVKPSYEI